MTDAQEVGEIHFHGGGCVEQIGIRLTSASTRVGVEVGAELGKNFHF